MAKNYAALKERLLNQKKSEPFQTVSMIYERGKSFDVLTSEYFKIAVLAILILLATLWHRNAHAQVSPYSLSPKWMFGRQAGLDFSSGSPVNLAGNPNNDSGQEATTTICDTSGQIAIYSNNSRINDRSNTQLQLVNGFNGMNGGQSSTNGAVAVPDPSSPISQYYLFTGNDNTGGSSSGINWYRISRNTTTGVLTTLSGPNNIATGSQVMEALCSGSDGNGGYWIVSHAQSGANEYWAWRVTSSGVSSVVKSNSSTIGGGSAGSVKISQCQDRIVFYSWAGGAEVYTWNKSTGTSGTLLWSNSNLGAHAGFGYGCEFSPNGNMAYFTNLINNKLYHLDISSNTLTDISAGGSSNNETEMGTLQLGPDDKLYVTNVSNLAKPTYIGVISNPNNVAASCGYNRQGYTLNPGPSDYPSIYRGIANIAWLNPQSKPFLTYTNTTCGYTFTAGFKNYFNKNITASVVSWNFGDGTSGTGSPIIHNYTASGTYLVSVTITDGTCGQTWTSTTTSITATCPIPSPVTWLSFDAINEKGMVKLTWSTTKEINNAYFDLQRSADGIGFISIGKIGSNSTQSSTNDYSFLDSNPIKGNNYYKLIQYDLDGSYSESRIVSLGVGRPMIQIVPNPSENEFVVTIDSKTEASLQIVNLQGGMVTSEFPLINEETIKIGSSLSAGVYLLKVTNGENTYFEKIVKQ